MHDRAVETVGIDLGTTNSALAYCDPHRTPRIVPAPSGQMVTPSVVCFSDEGIVVGEPAVHQPADRVVRFIKVHMGDPWGRDYQGRRYTPESVSALILRQLVRQAEPQIGSISRAVITVPAYFTEKRRRATEQAGQIAGLEVAATLNEPMAAVLSYGLDQVNYDEKIVVYDLGGGTFDVTVVSLTSNEIAEIATAGNRTLGGRNWDESLMELIAARFLRATGEDLFSDSQAVDDLRVECEQAKRTLSQFMSARVRACLGNRVEQFNVTRDEFEQATASLLHTTRLTTEMALDDAGLHWEDISRVLLVGGATQMPAVRTMLREASSRRVETSVNPMLAVGLGAAVYGQLLESGSLAKNYRQLEQPEPASTAEDLTAPRSSSPHPATIPTIEPTADELRDDSAEATAIPANDPGEAAADDLPRVRFVTAHGVGVLTCKQDHWKNAVLIAKNTAVPVEAVRRFVTASEEGEGNRVVIEITQGDTDDPDLAEVLGTGHIEGFSAAEPAGQPVDVQMRFDATGRLHVRAIYVNTGQELSLDLQIPDVLRPDQLQAQRQHIRGVRLLSLYDPEAPDA